MLHRRLRLTLLAFALTCVCGPPLSQWPERVVSPDLEQARPALAGPDRIDSIVVHAGVARSGDGIIWNGRAVPHLAVAV